MLGIAKKIYVILHVLVLYDEINFLNYDEFFSLYTKHLAWIGTEKSRVDIDINKVVI